jgi:hypothetical protein
MTKESLPNIVILTNLSGDTFHCLLVDPHLFYEYFMNVYSQFFRVDKKKIPGQSVCSPQLFIYLFGEYNGLNSSAFEVHSSVCLGTMISGA